MADEKKNDWANVKWPAAFVHTSEFTDSKGVDRTRAVLSIPSGTEINGMTVPNGYAVSTLLNDFALDDIANGERYVHVGFPADKKVELFGKDRETGKELPKIEVEAFALVKGIADGNKAFDEKGKSNWANVKWPAAFVHDKKFTDKNGVERVRAVCAIPAGVKINGEEIPAGYAVSTILGEKAQRDIMENQPYVHVAFKNDGNLELFGTDRDSGEKLPAIAVAPFDLCHGVAESNKAFEAAKEAKKAQPAERKPGDLKPAADKPKAPVQDQLITPDSDARAAGQSAAARGVDAQAKEVNRQRG